MSDLLSLHNSGKWKLPAIRTRVGAMGRMCPGSQDDGAHKNHRAHRAEPLHPKPRLPSQKVHETQTKKPTKVSRERTIASPHIPYSLYFARAILHHPSARESPSRRRETGSHAALHLSIPQTSRSSILTHAREYHCPY